MSGEPAQRGFVVQTIVAIIERLERKDWDEFKMEPETDLDQVGFRLNTEKMGGD